MALGLTGAPLEPVLGENSPFLAFFSSGTGGDGHSSGARTSLVAGGGPGWDRALSWWLWAGWQGRTRRTSPDTSGQSKPGPRRAGAGAGPGRACARQRSGGCVAERRPGLRRGGLVRGRRCHSRRRGARSSLHPLSPVSQSPFQPLCGLLTGGGWSYIKAHYENYNIGPRACRRRQRGSFQALSPCSAGLSCKISI